MLTAEDIYDFQKCPHRVYLNRHGDANKKRPLAQFLDLLFRRGHGHEKSILGKLVFQRPSGATLEERRSATLELMKNGVDLIYQGVLETPRGRGIPDLLRRAGYQSVFGEHAYEPIDVKSGRGYESKESDTLKSEYGLQMAFYSMLLESIQGVYPRSAYIINIEGIEIPFNPNDFRAALEHQLPEIEVLVDGSNSDEPAKCGSCSVCAWQDLCFERLKAANDVTLVVGIGRSMKKDLIAAGVKSVQDVTKLDNSSMRIKGIAATRALKFSRQARSYLENKMYKLPGNPMDASPYRVYFDFEDDPLQALIYLYGFVVVEPDGSHKYKMIWCDSKEGERGAFEEFCKFCSEISGKDYKVYHYATHERTVIRKLREAYPVQNDIALEEYLSKMVDLNKEVAGRAVLPTLGYGLKEVSKFIGFKYTDEDPGGAQSIAWFQDYQRDPVANAALKERILAYNRDDCEATKAVHEWLIKLG